MKMDIRTLWDFGDPEISEARFLEAMYVANEDEKLILKTQIARSYGMRMDFDRAREILSEVQPGLETVSDEVNAWYLLELGRTYCSTAHAKEALTTEAREIARSSYRASFEQFRKLQLDFNAIDALHMMTTVDTAPDKQMHWNQQALDFMEQSGQVEAKKWEGSLRNNLGYAYHLAQRYEEALVDFDLSLKARQAAGNDNGVRIAKWMIARTLRAKDRLDEALVIQLDLEKEWDKIGSSDTYVYEELEHLYRQLGDTARADYYQSKQTKA